MQGLPLSDAVQNPFGWMQSFRGGIIRGDPGASKFHILAKARSLFRSKAFVHELVQHIPQLPLASGMKETIIE
jgi:hypothetical protein